MNRHLAEGFIIDGDLEGLDKIRPSSDSLSSIFIDCINNAYGKELDKMVESCLYLAREDFGMYVESDVDYRDRAVVLAPVLDVFSRSLSGNTLPDDNKIMDLWAGSVNTTDIDWEKLKLKCIHNWSTYKGLFETYEYCGLCNERKK